MARATASTVSKPVLITKNLPVSRTKGAVSFQDFNKRTTATKPIRGGRSFRGGRR
jgi:hypothetical protein